METDVTHKSRTPCMHNSRIAHGSRAHGDIAWLLAVVSCESPSCVRLEHKTPAMKGNVGSREGQIYMSAALSKDNIIRVTVKEEEK